MAIKKQTKFGNGIDAILSNNFVATLGAELTTNGTFTGNATGWTLGAGWTYSNNSVTCTMSAAVEGTLSQSITVESGADYYVTWSTLAGTTHCCALTPSIGSAVGTTCGYNSNGAQIITANTNGTVTFSIAVSDFLNSGTIILDSISIKKITPTTSATTFEYSADAFPLEMRKSNVNKSFGLGARTYSYNISGDANTSVGSFSGMFNTTGVANTSFGAYALMRNTIGTSNTAFGHGTLLSNNSGFGNTAVGRDALWNNGSGFTNVAVGQASLNANTVGFWNTGVGVNSLYTNTSGVQNVAVGGDCMHYSNTGGYNTAIGCDALFINSTGSFNSAVGQSSLWYNGGGTYNSALGYAALNIIHPMSVGNVGIGYDAGNIDSRTAGGTTYTGVTLSNGVFNNTLGLTIGQVSWIWITASSNANLPTSTWTLVYNDGNSTKLFVQSTSYDGTYTLIKDSGARYDYTTCLGTSSRISGSHQVQLGSSSDTTYCYGAVQNRSDARDKTEIRDTILGLDFINALRPVDFKWDYREQYEIVERDEKGNVLSITKNPSDGSKKGSRFHHGLIAQEVKSILETQGIDFGGYQDHAIKGGDDVLSIGYDELIAPLIKSVQQLSAENATLKEELALIKSHLGI